MRWAIGLRAVQPAYLAVTNTRAKGKSLGPTEIIIVLTILAMVVVAVAVGRIVVPRILYVLRRDAALKAEDDRIRKQERDQRYQQILDRERGNRGQE